MNNQTSNLKSQPQTILFTHYGDNWIRGSERCLLDLITHIDKQKFSPIVWCNSKAMEHEVKKLGIPVILGNFSLLYGWQAPRFDYMHYQQLVNEAQALIKTYKVDLLYANGGAPSQWLNRVAQVTQKPLVTQLHSRYPFRDRLTLKLHNASKTIGVSQPIIDQLLEDGVNANQLQVVPNGIDTQRLLQQPIINLRQYINATENDFVIASIGSLIERKGMDILINAIALLKQQQTQTEQQIKVVIFGSGPEEQALERLIFEKDLAANVFLFGEKNNAFGMIKGTADLFISGAREEVFGLVLAEAGLAKLPVIAPKVGGIPSVVVDQKTGILIEPENPQAMADSIGQIMQNPDQLNKLGCAAYQHVQANFSIEQNVQHIEQLLTESLSSTQTKFKPGLSNLQVRQLIQRHLRKVVSIKCRTLLAKQIVRLQP